MASVYKRGGVWWVRFQWQGQEVRRSARTAVKAEAREYLEDLRQQYRTLGLGGRPRVSFRDAAAAYLTEHAAKKKVSTIASYQQCLKVLDAEFGQLMLDEITRAKVAAFEAGQGKRVSPSKVKHYRAVLSGVFKVAIRHDWLEANPCRSLDPISVKNDRHRYLTAREWQKLRDALQEPERSIAEISIERGMRCGEILALEWRDINLSSDTITMRDTKGNRPRVIPLEGARDAILRQAKRAGAIFQTSTGFPLRVDNTTRKINAAAKDAGIKDFTFHDLRHTFASWYVQRGGDLYRLQVLLGHKSPAMTQRYAHLRVDDLREPAQKRIARRDQLH